MATFSELIIRVGADIRSFETDLAKIDRKVKRFSNQMKDVGGRLTGAFTLPLAGAGFAAITMSNDFNSAMANVGTLIPGNIQRVEELKASVQGLAVEVGKNTQDLADGLYQAISAFGDSADTAAILEANAKAAAAGLATTTDAINLTSAVTKGYGDVSAATVQRASDLAFIAVKLGQTTFPELAASIGRVVPLTAALGVKQEELFAVMATATGVTGNAAEVSTQLRGVLQSLMAPTEAMSDLIQKMGFSSGQAMLQQLGLQGTISTIVQAATASGEPLQKLISQIEGQTLALALAGPQAQVFADKLKAMETAAGATDQAFKDQTEGVNKAGFAWSQFQQRMATTIQTLGDQLAPALMGALEAAQPLIDWLGQAVQWFAGLDQGTKTWVIGLGVLLAALGPVICVVGMVVSGIAALASPIGIAVVAIGALGAAGIALAVNGEKIKARILETWDGIKDGIAKAVNAIIGLINRMIDAFNRIPVMPNLPKLPSFGTPKAPEIPKFHSGGIFRAPTPGGEGLAVLRDRERVLRPGESGGVTVNVSITGNQINSDLDMRRLASMAADEVARRVRADRLAYAR